MRSDGRKRSDYRPMELETDIVSQANGSARLRLANTDILVGVKTEIDIPHLESPNSGKIEFFVDWFVIVLLYEILLLEVNTFDYAKTVFQLRRINF